MTDEPSCSGKPILFSSELWHTGGDLQKLPWCCLLVFVLCTEPPHPKAVEPSSVTKSKLGGKVSFCIMPAVIVCDFHSSVTLSVCPTGLLVWRYFLTYLWCFQNNLKLSVLAKPLQANWKSLSGHQSFKYRNRTCWRECVTVIWIQC